LNSNEVPRIDPKHTRFRLRLGKSNIHRWGVYAGENIAPNLKVIEYTGERISRRETKIRAARPLNYIFTLDSYWSIDGAAGGSGAEFINHSCEPNCEARIVRGHILYFSKRPIRKGEELTVDYHFAHDEERTPCSCGSKNCRGTINLRGPEKVPGHKR
jgi:SET domain-containing protein